MDQYLAFGGLPETFDLPDNLKLNYRRSTIEKIVVNDILKRFEIQSTELLYRILQYLEKNIGTIVSFNNLAHASQADDKTIANLHPVSFPNISDHASFKIQFED